MILCVPETGNIDFNVVNNGTFPAVATVTVIPIIENLGVSCSGPIQTFTVTVNGNVDDQEDISNYNGFEISCFEANDGYINLNPIGAIKKFIYENFFKIKIISIGYQLVIQKK